MLKHIALAGILLYIFVIQCNGQMDRNPPPKGATMDGLIAKAMGGLDAIANKITGSDGKILAELDMKVSLEQYKALYGSKSARTKRKAVKSTVYRWTNGQVPYIFRPGASYGAYDKSMIRVAMREWEKYTCLRFNNRTSEQNYIVFDDGFGCNSELGMIRGPQTLNLDKPTAGCRYKGLYLHEIGHAVGLVHEHQRPIRDDWIDILYKNVRPDMRIWFNSYNNNTINNYNIPYEYSSVMHYGVTAFSIDGQAKTIQPKPQYASREKEIGVVYAKELSFTDIATVNRMYGCANHCDGSVACDNGGVLDENCRCICPDGSTDCTVGKSNPDPKCVNLEGYNWRCNIWAKQGECERNPDWMNVNCKRACGECGDAFKEDSAVGCRNLYPDDKCSKWRDIGDCEQNKRWMSVNCKLACNVCDDDRTSATTPKVTSPKRTTVTSATTTESPSTTTTKPSSTTTTKPSSTTITKPSSSTTKPTSTIITTLRPSTTRPTTTTTTELPKSTTEPPTTTVDCSQDCKDIFRTDGCVKLDTLYKFCSKYPEWMGRYCKKTCNLCTDNNSSLDVCMDNNKYCASWAEYDHCELNPSYMTKCCRKSCQICSSES